MVHGHDQQMRLGRLPDQAHAQQRPGLQVEGLAVHGGRRLFQLFLALRSGSSDRSVCSTRTLPCAAITCTTCPSPPMRNTVRSDSWRATSASKLCCSASTSSVPSRRSAPLM